MNPLYTLRDVGMRYGDAEVLAGVSLALAPGEFTAIIGPNGAGKSTLMGILAGLRAQYTGMCEYAGTEARKWNRRMLARQVSFVPQSVRIEFPFTAEQVVLMGRTPHCDGLFEAPEDWRAVDDAVHRTGIGAFRARDFRSLSGGERQLVILASAIAQQPRTLLLDEPATFLDIRHQIEIYRLLRDSSRSGLLVVAVTHDLNLAATYADRVVALNAGRVIADATPREVLSPPVIRDVFGVSARAHERAGGRTWIEYGE